MNEERISMLLLVLLLVLIGGLVFGFEKQILALRQEVLVAQQESQQAVLKLSQRLQSQESVTQSVEEQAKNAQSALTLLQKQTQAAVAAAAKVSSSNAFPTISTRAIVLVICFDPFGNAQSGSGTIINPAGEVLTNNHVVTGQFGEQLSCGALMNDGSSAPALQKNIFYTLTSDANSAIRPDQDAALLKITGAIDPDTKLAVKLPTTFPFIRPDNGGVKQGDILYVFGYPAASNLVFNATKGIVSSLSSDGVFINTDAVIDHGNSGGAAITADGRFIGIPTQKYIGNNDYLGQILNIRNLPLP